MGKRKDKKTSEYLENINKDITDNFNFLTGIGSIMEVFKPVNNKVLQKISLSLEDNTALNEDWENIGKDFERSLDKLDLEEEVY